MDVGTSATSRIPSNPAGPVSSTPQSGHAFVSPGILLFIDQMLVAIANWVYWIVVSRFVITSEVGHATTIYSLVLLVSTIAQLGLEYPLLKKSVEDRRRLFGSVLLIEIGITVISLPVLFWSSSFLYGEPIEFTLIAVGILVLSSVGFVSRFALLGISQTKTVLILDVIGTVLKFGAALALISAGYGAIGILASFLVNAVVMAVGATLLARRHFGLGIGDALFRKDIIKGGLANMPSKLSGFFIISLSIILLAYLGVEDAQIGTFYIAMMMSIVAGSFASSLAYMSIPASSQTKTDLSNSSLRIGLAFTAPIITLLVLAPAAILGVVGSDYVAASNTLPILAAAVLPSVILSNASSKFNNLNHPKKLAAIGLLRVVIFLGSFFSLVPEYGTIGAAYSILLSFAGSAILSLALSERTALKYVVLAIASIGSSVLVGMMIFEILSIHAELAVALVCTGVCGALILAFRCISIPEISLMAKAIFNRWSSS